MVTQSTITTIRRHHSVLSHPKQNLSTLPWWLYPTRLRALLSILTLTAPILLVPAPSSLIHRGLHSSLFDRSQPMHVSIYASFCSAVLEVDFINSFANTANGTTFSTSIPSPLKSTSPACLEHWANYTGSLIVSSVFVASTLALILTI